MMSSPVPYLYSHMPKSAKIRLGPSGIHLFDRNSGLNLLIDEVVLPEEIWAPAPRQVSIALTNACDLRCAYCFAPKSGESLSFGRVVTWLHELDANGTLGVGFGGGEPTLFPRFVDLCAYTARHTGLAVTFTTHGHHLNDVLLSALRGNVHFIRISVDGIGATYERLRGRPFSALRHRLAAVRELAPFGINYVVNSDTFPDIDAAARFAETAGASEFLLLPERAVNARAGIDEATNDRLNTWATRYSGGMRLSISEASAHGLPTCNPFPNETGLRAYAHIAATAVIKRTSYDSEGVAINADGVMSALNELNYLSEGIS